jgi:hypothetical protein
MGLPPLVVFQQLNSGMSVFTLLAIPFFIYAGDLMVRGGIAERHRRLRRLPGRPSARRARPGQHRRLDPVRRHLRIGGGRGGGGRRADDPADEGARLRRDYAVNVTSMAALIALLLPPSHNMIIYSLSAAGTSRSPTSSPPASSRACCWPRR